MDSPDLRAEQAQRPRLSIIIPVYNAQRWVPQCLECLAGQTLESYEAVFVDDCSTDSTADMLEAAAVGDPRIKVFRLERNGGPGPARNAGIDLACGECLCFLDADDRYGSADYLKALCDAIDESGLSVAAARFANEREGGAVERDFPEDGLYWGYSLHESGPLPFDRFQFDYGFHRFAFKRSLFCDGANRFPSLRYYEDPLFLARILHQAGSFYALPDQEYLYRCDYRKPSWTTPKVLDYLRGTRENLVFSREKGLARLHWVTAMRLDWECGKIGIGVRDDLDLQAVSDALALVEAEIDPVLLGQGGPVGHPFRLLMRGTLDSLPERSALDAALAKARYGFVNSRVWYRLRPFVVGRLMGR